MVSTEINSENQGWKSMKMRDKIVYEIRKIRKEIESENNSDWNQIEKYLVELQERHKSKLYKGKPEILPVRDIA